MSADPVASRSDRLRIQETLERAGRPRRFIWIFGAALVLSAGTAFLFKLYEFYHTATTSGPEALGSFLIPVLNYLVVASGFFCLFLWAYLSGQFRDLEAPKYRMLERELALEALEARAVAPGTAGRG